MTRYLLLPGINNDLGSVDGWHIRAACEIMRRGLGYALPFSYSVNALDHQIWLNKHVRQTHKLLGMFCNLGDDIRIVAHSRGCNLALELLRRHPEIAIRRLDLIAPAVEADCDKNGLNQIMEIDQARECRIWMPEKDEALSLADLIPMLGFGFSLLGKSGPQNMTRPTATFTKMIPTTGGHSDMFGEQWGETIDRITEPCP